MARVGISLGSNLGDRLGNLREAAAKLRDISRSEVIASSVYETEPVDCPEGSPGFYNAVLEFTTDLSPVALLDFTQRIESEAGRPETREVNSPRPIDVDLLFYGDTILESERLTLPHPRMFEREFVLRPLFEISSTMTPKGYQPDGSVEMPIIGTLFE